MGIIKRALQKRALERDLSNKLEQMMNLELAPQAILRLFLEITDLNLKAKLFKILKKVFSRLSFNDIYPVLKTAKMPDSYKNGFWKMVIKFGVDSSELLNIIIYSDYFFADKAFNELVKRFQKGRIPKDRMMRFLVQIITKRLEFGPKAWLLYKDLCKERSPSSDDLVLICDEQRLHSPPFAQISEEAKQMKEKVDIANKFIEDAIAEIKIISQKIKTI